MGCAVSCVNRTTMALFGRQSAGDNDARAKLERKLYLAKESPEPDFDLSECQLSRVPSGIFTICKVYRKEHLYFQKNNLQSLEDGGQLSDLYLIKTLNINCNKFSLLSNDIRYLVNLSELYISDNYLKEIPEDIQYLQNLHILDVSNNRLKALTSCLGKLMNLRKLNLTGNKELKELCPELCFATNMTSIQIDGEQFIFPPPEVITQGTAQIMKFLCNKLDLEYCPPVNCELDGTIPARAFYDPFMKRNTITWEEQEAAVIAQENKIHEAAKQQREKFITQVMQEQVMLDSEIAKIQITREEDRQRLIKSIQDSESEIECLVRNFIQSEDLKPEVVQQQLAHEQAEHDRLLEIARQNYDNIRKSDILKAMETLIEEDYSIQHSKKHYEDSFNTMRQSMLTQELEGVEKLQDMLKSKDESRSILVRQLLEDQDVQKAIVASLVERVDSRTWSINEEISIIFSNIAKLSVIEQEKKKLYVAYNYNELLHQRVQLVNLLDDLLDQRNKRRKQLIDTLKEMESQTDMSADFWLKNYQKLIDSAPKTLLDIGKHLDPVFANFLLQESVIHCLPFLVKFLFSDRPLVEITPEELKACGVSLSSDREGILRAIDYYVATKSYKHELESTSEQPCSIEKPSEPPNDEAKQFCTGVVTASHTEDSVLNSECVICMDSRCEIVFVPCGHMCCCQSCSNTSMVSCPMCRTDIERQIKVMIP